MSSKNYENKSDDEKGNVPRTRNKIINTRREVGIKITYVETSISTFKVSYIPREHTIKLALSMYQDRGRMRATMRGGYKSLPASLPWDEKFNNAREPPEFIAFRFNKELTVRRCACARVLLTKLWIV